MNKNHDIIEVVVLKKHETEQAVLVLADIGDEKGVWLPKSQIEVQSVDDEGFAEISLPEWLAVEKGLI